MSIKRFVVFAMDQYYPRGGWDDHRDNFETLDEALKCAFDITGYDYIDILDLQTGEYKPAKSWAGHLDSEPTDSEKYWTEVCRQREPGT